MKKLVTVTSIDVKKLLKEYDVTWVYPLKDYCVGYEHEFEIQEIDDFCLINRILDDDDLDKLEGILKDSKIKGIVFDDLGVLEIIKDMNVTKILLLDHLATNTKSINYYLEYVDSVVVSSDLTRDEITSIVQNSHKPLVVNVFGLKPIMYSRRTLLSNYEAYHKLPLEDYLMAEINNKKFFMTENKWGTKVYAYPFYCAFELEELDNIVYAWYDVNGLDGARVKKVLDKDIQGIPTTSLFLDEKIVYKVSDIDD